MKILNIYAIVALLLLSRASIAQHYYSSNPLDSNASWLKLESINTDKVPYKYDFASQQAKFLKYREEGLKFWEAFPKDVRKYQWLLNTVAQLGGYLNYWIISSANDSYNDILYKGVSSPTKDYEWPLNEISLQEWEKKYPSLKKEFLNYYAKAPNFNLYSGGPNVKLDIRLIGGELWSFLNLSLNQEYRKKGKINLDKLREIFIEAGSYINKINKEDSNALASSKLIIFSLMDNNFIARYQQYGLNAGDMRLFFNSIKEGFNAIVRDWAIQRSSLFELMKSPLSFKSVSIIGDTIDLDKMRGKVVLLDFWSVWCSGCVERMPAIKQVYDKYKVRGFEVVSICANNQDKLQQVKAIEKKIGAEWPILMIGQPNTKNTLGQYIFRKYGFWGVPQLLLLDKKGKLVMLNDKLRDGDFEPDVKKLLAENYNSNN